MNYPQTAQPTTQQPTLNAADLHLSTRPSAGVTMVTSIVSALTGIAIRGDVAMTGEVTLRGRVLAIGGLKEKLLAAVRGGIKTALIPKENLKYLADVPDNIKDALTIIPVSMVDEVLLHALVGKTTSLTADEIAQGRASAAAHDDKISRRIKFILR